MENDFMVFGNSYPDWFAEMVTNNKIITHGDSWAQGGAMYGATVLNSTRGEQTVFFGDYIFNCKNGPVAICPKQCIEIYKKAHPNASVVVKNRNG